MEPASTENLEDRSRILQYLRRLPTREAEVVHLRFVEALGFSEIASVLEVSTSTAKTHCYRGLSKLREMLAQAEERLS